MRHLSDEAMKTIRSLLPSECYFVLIVATRDGTGIDTNIIDREKVAPFLDETARNMEWECRRTLDMEERSC